MTTICLPLSPTTNHLFAGRGRRYRSQEYEAWITEAGLELKRQRPSPCHGRVSLSFEVEEPKTARRQDISNRLKAAEDLLVSHRIIQGDDQRFVRKITLEWSAAITGIRITIAPYPE